MNFQTNPKSGFLIAGIIIFFVFGGSLFILLVQRSDIWWTPTSMMGSISDTSEQVTVYIKDKPLSDVVSNDALLLKTETGTVIITNADIGFRMNNWYKVRTAMLSRAIIATVFFTASILFIVYGLISMRDENKPEEIPVEST